MCWKKSTHQRTHSAQTCVVQGHLYSQSGVSISTINFRTFPLSRRETPCPLPSLPITPPPPLATDDVLSVCTDLLLQDISYTWTHTMGGLCLASEECRMFPRFIHAVHELGSPGPLIFHHVTTPRVPFVGRRALGLFPPAGYYDDSGTAPSGRTWVPVSLGHLRRGGPGGGHSYGGSVFQHWRTCQTSSQVAVPSALPASHGR